MKTQVLPVELPRIDGDTQSRIEINEDTVSDYADIISAAGTEWPFPPLDVFFDGTDHFVADGFHRLLGALRTKRGSLPCRVHKGTAADARIFGMTANDKHGLRMSPADKRACVEWLLDNGGKMTQKLVAEKAGVSPRFVQKIVADRLPSSIAGKAAPPKRDGKAHRAPSTTVRGGKPSSAPPIASDDETEYEPDWDAEAQEEAPAAPETPPKGNGTPPKQYPRAHHYKQFDQLMATIVRMTDKIADAVGENHDPLQEKIHDHLNKANEFMAEWMQVKL